MTAVAPSHPDDTAVRERLLVELRQRREAAGIARLAVARVLGVNELTVRSAEMHRPANPCVGTLVKYSAPLGFTLALELDGIVTGDPTAEESLLLAGGFIGNAMVVKLRRVREQLGISRKDIEARHGWKWCSVAGLEYGNREPRLSTLQRYARIVGGRIDARWEDL